MRARRSLGGKVVDTSLAAVGWCPRPGVALVETGSPRGSQTVLAQSAWNFISRSQFNSLISRYPAPMRARAELRRALAAVNVRRARTVVCLTHAMGELVLQAHPRAKVVVSTVTAPLDIWTPPSCAFAPAQPMDDCYGLVPGTVTWYKRPELALTLIGEGRVAAVNHILFAGNDDGSGCWPALQANAARRGIAVHRQTVDRPSMQVAVRGSAWTLMPSELESLGFTLAEGLLSGVPVSASPIPSHVEVARRLDSEPSWITSETPRLDAARKPSTFTRGQAEREWRALAEALDRGQP